MAKQEIAAVTSKDATIVSLVTTAKEKTNYTPCPPPQKAAFCHICIIRKQNMEAI